MMTSFLRIARERKRAKWRSRFVHVYLINKFEVMDDPVEAVIYVPSISNKIER